MEQEKNRIELAFPKYEQENDGEFISKGGVQVKVWLSTYPQVWIQ